MHVGGYNFLIHVISPVADLEFLKWGFQYVIKECVECLLGESGGMPPPPRQNFGFLTSEIVSVGRLNAKPSYGLLLLLNHSSVGMV